MSATNSTPDAPDARLKVVSQAFRYCDYNTGSGQSRVLRIGFKPIQFIVNTWCEEALKNKEVEIGVEIRDRDTGEAIFETFWVTTMAYTRQQSSFIFRDFPQELESLTQGKLYSYHASALVNETDDYAERTTRIVAK